MRYRPLDERGPPPASIAAERNPVARGSFMAGQDAMKIRRGLFEKSVSRRPRVFISAGLL
jgi:hypothetical protein